MPLSLAVAPPPGAVELGEFVAGHPADCTWGGFGEETAAGLCDTSPPGCPECGCPTRSG